MNPLILTGSRDAAAQAAAKPVVDRFLSIPEGVEAMRRAGNPTVQRCTDIGDAFGRYDVDNRIVWLDADSSDADCLAVLGHEIRHAQQDNAGINTMISAMDETETLVATWMIEADAMAYAVFLAGRMAQAGISGPRIVMWNQQIHNLALMSYDHAVADGHNPLLGPFTEIFRNRLFLDLYEERAAQDWVDVGQHYDAKMPGMLAYLTMSLSALPASGVTYPLEDLREQVSQRRRTAADYVSRRPDAPAPR